MPEPNTFALENIALDHAIQAEVFIPFAIQRLQTDSEANEAVLQVRLIDIGAIAEREGQLVLRWLPTPAALSPVQEHVVTEWAALGVACAVVVVFAGLRIRAVTMAGDSFDYWLTDGERDFALEVSGTTQPDLEARHRVKVQQLLDNPFGAAGYVVVVAFDQRRVIFSFHARKEGQ